MTALRDLAARLERIEKLQRSAASTSQLGNSSFAEGAIEQYGPDGQLVQIVGTQPDQTYTQTSVNGPVPPAPSKPIVTPQPIAARVSWDGQWVDGAVAPLDLARIDVYIVDDGAIDPLTVPSRSSITAAGWGDAPIVLDPGTYTAYLVAWTQSGKYAVSDPSDEFEVLGIAVDTSALEAELAQLQSDLSDAEAELAQAKTDITTNASDITSAEALIATAQGQITSLSGQLGTLGSDLTDLDGQLSELNSELAGIPGDISTAASAAQAAAIAAAKLETDKINSRGTDLVVNGTGVLKNNTNFTAFTYVPTDAPAGSAGSFLTTAGAGTYLVNDYLPVSTTKRFMFSYWIRQAGTGVNGRVYGVISAFDSDKLPISPQYVMYQPGTTTSLAQDLNPGDTVIHLADVTATPFYGSAGKNAGGSTHYRSIIWWDWVDGSGKTWGPETYSRHWSGADYWADGAVDTAAKTITLKAPYAGTPKPAGTKLSNGSSGGTYMYPPGQTNYIPGTAWEYHTGSLSGSAQNGAAPSFDNGWPVSVAYARIGWLLNRTTTGLTEPGSQHAVSGVSFSDASAAQQTADSKASPADVAAGDAATLGSAQSDATTKANQAKADAIAAAATDATSKVNTAKVALQAEIDTLNNTTIPGLDSQLSTLDSDLTAAQGQITSLSGALDLLDDELAAVLPITETKIQDGSISTPKIQTDAITTDKVAARAITAAEIAVDTITANEIAADSITASEIAGHTITAAEIAARAITANEIAARAITANEIAADTITANEIAADSITASEIAGHTITAAEIAADTITANEIAANAITATEIATDAITAAKVKADAITTDKIAARAITAAKIAVDTITANEIAADAITANEIAADTITANEIAADAVTANEIAADAVTAVKIAADAVTAVKIAADAVTASKIQADAVTADKIIAEAVTAEKIGAEAVTAEKIAAGAVTAEKLYATLIEASEIYSQTGYFGDISFGSLIGGEISADAVWAAGSLTIGDPQASHLTATPGEAMILFGPDGLTPVIELRMDGQPSVFRGKVIADDVSVMNGIIIQGLVSTVAINARVTLESGVSDPSSAPSVSVGFQSANYPPAVSGYTERGIFWSIAHGCWYQLIVNNTTKQARVFQINTDGSRQHPILGTPGVSMALAIPDAAWSTTIDWRGLVVQGSNFYALGLYKRVTGQFPGNYWNLYKFNSSGNIVSSSDFLFPSAPGTFPTLGSEGQAEEMWSSAPILVAGQFLFGYVAGSDPGYVQGQIYSFKLDAKSSSSYALASNFSYATSFNTMTHIGFSPNYDHVSWKFALGSNQGIQLLDYDVASGTYVASGSFDGLPSNHAMTHDGANFYTVHNNGTLKKMSNWIGRTDEQDRTWFLANTNAVITPSVKETKGSPAAVIDVPNRRYVFVTAAPRAGQTTHDGIYAGYGTVGGGSTTGLRRQGGFITAGTLTLENKDVSGALIPTTSSFVGATGSPGEIVSQGGGFAVRGNGSGNWPMLAEAPPIGSLQPYAGASAPPGGQWLLANGAAVSRSTYAALYAVVGNTYGAGNGSTTFNLPNMTGNVPVGIGASYSGALGGTGGAATVTLTTGQIPSHTHPSYGFLVKQGTGSNVRALAASTDVSNVNTGPAGGDGSHNNLQPFLTVNYLIRAL